MLSIYEFVAYVIDFEGSIGLQRRCSSKNVPSYSPVISVTNTSQELLKKFQYRVGFGKVNNGFDRNGKARIYWWVLHVDKIKVHLPLIEPHLCLKREQAQLVLRTFEIMKSLSEIKPLIRNLEPGTLYSKEEYAELDSIYERIRFLNLRPSWKQSPETEAEKLLREFRRR